MVNLIFIVDLPIKLNGSDLDDLIWIKFALRRVCIQSTGGKRWEDYGFSY